MRNRVLQSCNPWSPLKRFCPCDYRWALPYQRHGAHQKWCGCFLCNYDPYFSVTMLSSRLGDEASGLAHAAQTHVLPVDFRHSVPRFRL